MTNTRATMRKNNRGGLFSQISAVLLHPVSFFGDLPPLGQTRQWLWMALVILAGAVVVLVTADRGARSTVDQWTAVLTLFAGGALVWFLLACLLSLVSMFNGQRPQFGVNLQVAIWSYAPFVVMSVLQWVYLSTGGEIGSVGLARVVLNLPAYQSADPLMGQIMLAFASQVTLFGIWQVILLMIGARQALKGKRPVIVLVALMWVAVVTVLPVVTGTLEVPAEAVTGGDMFPTDEFFPPGGFEEPPFFDGEVPPPFEQSF